MITMHAINRFISTALGLVLSTLLLASCGVTEPDATPWKNVADFSWPTTKGVTMKYQTIQADTVSDESEVTVDIDISQGPASFYNGQQMYVMRSLTDTVKPITAQMHYLPLQDTLVVSQDNDIGAAYALVAPLEKGRRWVASYTNSGDTALVAEVIELFSYRKIEGTVYENVVAVKYSRLKRLSNIYPNAEWIRFYAQGVGEIMTVRNVYPQESTLADPLPQQEQRRVLVETTATN